ncbi:MAG: transcriptional regulator NrdR [bacterium]|nr:transcriptional regulator NrdR [bacterium]
MRCPSCTHIENKVIDSRVSRERNVIRRRRECFACGRRFTTYERTEETMPAISKKDGRREPYDKEKLRAGIDKALEKRPISIEERDQMISRIEKLLQEKGEREVSSNIIGDAVMEELQSADEVAYVRFASVYRQFKDINEFMEELQDLLKESRRREEEAVPGQETPA